MIKTAYDLPDMMDLEIVLTPRVAALVGADVAVRFELEYLCRDVRVFARCRRCSQQLPTGDESVQQVLHLIPAWVVEQLELGGRREDGQIGRAAELARCDAAAQYVASQIAQLIADGGCSCVRDELAVRGGPQPRRAITLDLVQGYPQTAAAVHAAIGAGTWSQGYLLGESEVLQRALENRRPTPGEERDDRRADPARVAEVIVHAEPFTAERLAARLEERARVVAGALENTPPD